MRADLETLFERYRRRGDLPALTSVFDGTALDLLALAQHLVRDPHDAEDLVQSTFVTAIDRAESWRSDRPLRPWLTGILARHAANLVRGRSRRRTSGDGIADLAAGAPDPRGNAEAVELEGELERALARVGERYREVLEPYLRNGVAPRAIARDLGRSPGTVRAQIYRGLTRLRRLLPAGVAVASVRGLPAVRDAVVRHAAGAGAAASVSMASASLASGAVAGGWIVGKKTLVVGAGALVASLGLWLGGAEPLAPVERAPLVAAHAEAMRPVPLDPPEPPPWAVSAGTEVVRDAAADGRAAIRRGSAEIRGRLRGVFPEDVADVGISLRPASGLDLPADGQLGGREPSSIGQASVSSALVAGDVRQWIAPQAAWLQLSDPFVPLPRAELAVPGRALAEGAAVPAAGVRIAPDGSFVIDLTEALLAREREDPWRLLVTATHGLYFDARGLVELAASARDRVLAGETVAVSLDLELAPAAVLRGRVATPALDQGAWLTSSMIQPVEQSTRALVLWGSAETSLSMGEIALDGGGGTFQLSFVAVSGTELALLREGARTPLATTRAELDGSFDFKIAEEGPFALVVTGPERAPRTERVELRLREVVELEEPIELAEGARLHGVLEDFGAFPDGGVALEAARLDAPEESAIEWPGHALVWSRGEVVRARAEGLTDAGGVFVVHGLAAGPHRLRLADAGAATLFTEEERDAAAVEVRLPANDVQVVLPLAVLEVRAETPAAGDGEQPDLQLLVEDPAAEDGAPLAEVWLDEGRAEVVARPGRPLRLRVQGAGLAFDGWSGTTPGAGGRREVVLLGRVAPETEPQDG